MWSSSELQKNILQKLIAKFEQAPLPTTPYLFSNYHAAQSLLFAYVSLFDTSQTDKFAQKSVEALEQFMQANSEIAQAEVALAGKYLGAAWLLQHLVNIEILDPEDASLLIDLDEMVEDSLLQNFQHQNYDTLYGLVSKGIYYLERLPHEKSAQAKLEQIVMYLDQIAVKENGLVCWQDHFTMNGTPSQTVRYNLGLAHGIPGIISFLAKAYQNNILPEASQSLLEGGVQWLVRQELKTKPGHFPFSVTEGEVEDAQSRLAWCYGDLCVVVALMHAAHSLKQDKWKQQAIDIALRTTQWATPQEAGLNCNLQEQWMDSGLCHGSGGVAHMYRKMYQATGQEAFREAADHWLQTLIKYYQYHTDATAEHYKRMKVNPETKTQYWVEDYSFLEGYAGIALVILGFLDEQHHTSWERVLLLDIA